MSLDFVVHALALALAFIAAAYLVLAAAQKADGVLKPVGFGIAGVLALSGALVLVIHLGAPLFGDHRSASTPASAAAGASPGAPQTAGNSAPAGEAGGKPAAEDPNEGDDTGGK